MSSDVKNGLRCFRPGPTQTRLCSHRGWLEAQNFGFRKKRDCMIHVTKTLALISCDQQRRWSVVWLQLICVFIFVYAIFRFSPNKAQIWVLSWLLYLVWKWFIHDMTKLQGVKHKQWPQIDAIRTRSALKTSKWEITKIAISWNVIHGVG